VQRQKELYENKQHQCSHFEQQLNSRKIISKSILVYFRLNLQFILSLPDPAASVM
jgi:hypothetical protein